MKNQTDLVERLHMAEFIPVNSTYMKSIQKRYFQSWTGLIVQLVNTYLPNILFTVIGHIDHARKNMRSTKPVDKEDTEDATIRNNGEVTNLAFTGIEMKGHTRDDIYGSNRALISYVN